MRDRKMQHCKMLHQTASAKNAGPAIQYAMAENVGLENAGNDIVWKTCKVQSTVRTVYSLLRSSRQLGYTPVTTLRSDLLWSPYVIGQTIIFLSCFFLLASSFFFLLSSFFPRLISAVGNWMFTILWHMMWP